MTCCVIIHDERALTLLILSNFGMGFKSTLLPAIVIKIAYPVRHSPFDKVLLAQIANFVELAKSPDFAGGDRLFTANSLSFAGNLHQARIFARAPEWCERWGSFHAWQSWSHRGMFFWQPCEQAMLFGDKAPRFFCLDTLEQLDTNTVHLSGM